MPAWRAGSAPRSTSPHSCAPPGSSCVADLHFVIGGAASGRSRFAVERALALGGDQVSFVATARPGDPELDERIAAHRRARPIRWRTIDAGRHLAAALAAADPEHVLLIDSLTLWVAAALEAGDDPLRAWSAAAEVVRARVRPAGAVSDEGGLGVVPPTGSGRHFRQALGRLTQLCGAGAS